MSRHPHNLPSPTVAGRGYHMANRVLCLLPLRHRQDKTLPEMLRVKGREGNTECERQRSGWKGRKPTWEQTPGPHRALDPRPPRAPAHTAAAVPPISAKRDRGGSNRSCCSPKVTTMVGGQMGERNPSLLLGWLCTRPPRGSGEPGHSTALTFQGTK